MTTNPYNWQSHNPQVEIPRADVGRFAKTLAGNGSGVVLGGRGMGKSVFLRQVREELEKDPGTRVLLLETPPATLTVDACLDFLANELDVPTNRFTSRRFLDAFFARSDAPERLVLLFDEFDRYAEKTASSQPPARGFFNDLEASRRSLPQLGVLAVGSIGVFVLRDVLGSSFLSRALHGRLRPLARADVDVLASPFAERGSPLSEDVLDALFLTSGGIPAILTFGLQRLWELDRSVSPLDVTFAYKAFKIEHPEYISDLLNAIENPAFSNGPLRVWKRIVQGPDRIARNELEAALGEPSGMLKLTLSDALHLLEAVGVVHLEGDVVYDSHIRVRPIAGLLNLPHRSPEESDDPRLRFVQDIVLVLDKLHRSSADFFRPGPKGEEKRLVPESVFTAFLSLGLEFLGWRSEREAQRAAGRTDLLLRRNGDAQTVVVENKIWGRNDYRDAHRQVESYWTSDTVAGAVVQLTDAELPDWPERYRNECLEPLNVNVEEMSTEGSPVAARFRCSSKTADGLDVVVDHFLLRLARRS